MQVKGHACCPRQSHIGAPSHWWLNANPRQLPTATQCGQILRSFSGAPGSIAKHVVQQSRLHAGVEHCLFVPPPIRTLYQSQCQYCLISFVTPSLFACHVRFFIYLHSATAAHKSLMRLIRRLVESPVLGTACLEHPAAHSLKILLPERRMDICIIRLDCSCEA